MHEIYKKINDLLYKQEKFAVATIIRTEGSTPRNVGAKMIVTKDGNINGTIGGGHNEATVIAEAVKAIKDGKTRILTFRLEGENDSGMICGGNMDVYIEPAQPAFSILFLGGGNIGKALSKLAHTVGFSVSVIDPLATKEDFPDADQIISKKAVEGLSEVNVTPETCIVIATAGHEGDEATLRKVIDMEATYIGMIGSKNKVKTIFKNIVDSGVSEDKLCKIHSPIGLDIGSETPMEIAVSIIAEIISVIKGGTGHPLSGR